VSEKRRSFLLSLLKSITNVSLLLLRCAMLTQLLGRSRFAGLVVVLLMVCGAQRDALAQATRPTITSFSPISGSVGDTVSVIGTNFFAPINASNTASQIAEVRIGRVPMLLLSVRETAVRFLIAPGSTITGAPVTGRIVLITRNGDTIISSSDFVVRNVAPPQVITGTPTLLAPANGSENSAVITYQWSPVAGADYYELETTSEDSTFKIGVITSYPRSNSNPSTTTICKQNQPNLPKWWRVRARKEGNPPAPGPWSSTGRLIPSKVAELPSPTISGLQVRGDSVFLSWQPVSGALYYEATIGDFSSRECAYQRTTLSFPRSISDFPIQVSVRAYNNLAESPVRSRSYNGNGTFTTQPTITGLFSTGVPGTTVVIQGTLLKGARFISFGGVNTTAFNAVTSTGVDAVIPYGAKTGRVTITTPDGIATSPTDFTIRSPAPTITSFSPPFAGVGTSVTITGT
jgi:IPT/TIG domain